MKQDGVNIAFELIVEEIAAVEAQLKHEGELAFRESRYKDAERLSIAGEKLSGFRENLDALQKEWCSSVDVEIRSRVKVESAAFHLKPHKKKPASKALPPN